MADGMQTNGADVQQAVTAALDAQKKQKKKKRLIILGIVAALIVVIGIAAGGSDDSPSNPAPVQSSSADGTSAANAVAENKSENNVGKYKVTLKSSRITKDYDGNSILIVTYNFQNNDSEPKCFAYSVEDKAYQNGVELGDVWTSYGIDNYSFDEASKEIKPGVSLDLQCAYELNDNSTDVEIELSQWLSDKVQQKYTIKLK